jgi:site-specific DNA-adenine methylase
LSEKTGLDNPTYDILSALGKDADFLYDDINKYIRDAESDNNPELVEIWKTIRNDHQKHVDMLKDALEKKLTTKTTS